MAETTPEVTRCLVCGRKVTDPDSVARRIGTECWRRLQALKSQRKRKRVKKKSNVKTWEQPELFAYKEGEEGCKEQGDPITTES